MSCIDRSINYEDFIESPSLINKYPELYHMLKDEHDSNIAKYASVSKYGGNVEKYLVIRRRAKDVVLAGGREYFDANGNKRTEFKQKDLSITLENDRIEIIYLDTIVLSETHYYPGKWEDIITKLYIDLEKIMLSKDRENNTIKNIQNIIAQITDDNGEIDINGHIKVVKFNHDDIQEEYVNKGVCVEVDGEVMYADYISGFEHYGSTPVEKKFYQKGLWENEISDFLEQHRLKKELKYTNTKRL